MNNKKTTRNHVLIVDDDESLRAAIGYVFKQDGFLVSEACSAQEMFEFLSDQTVDVLLLDLYLTDGDSLPHLARLKSEYPNIQVIMATGSGTIDTAVEALRRGAFDFITKPVDTRRLLSSVRGALRLARAHTEQGEPPSARLQSAADPEILGESAAMTNLKDLTGKVSTSDCAVLVLGESGTGKELVAQLIHRCSPRQKNVMPVVNCGALPSELVESELFGHEKGSFTGATRSKTGFAELADGGTLFLDEIGEMPVDLQAKLLRFLENKSFHRVGGTREIVVDTRVICATNKEPQDLVREGKMREDLFYRISQVTLRIPSLRERKDDIPLLARSFLRRVAKSEGKEFDSFSPDAIRVLTEYHWPGNVRHLQNVITEIVVLHDGTSVDAGMIPSDIVHSVHDRQYSNTIPDSSPPSTEKSIQPIWEMEKKAMREALVVCQGNVGMAAKQLQVSQATLYRKIKRYDLNVAAS